MWFALLISAVAALNIETFKNVKISNLVRSLVVHERYIKSEVTFTLQNNEYYALQNFHYTLPNAYKDKIYHLALVSGSNKIKPKRIEDLDVQYSYNVTVYQFPLPEPLENGASISLKVEEYFFNRYEPLPKKIQLTDDQLLVFEDSVLFRTPYPVESQRTLYKVSRVLSYSLKQNVVERGTVVEYGPFKDVEPFTVLNTRLHVENNHPLIVFKQVEKTIEVSHWGNIAVEESYSLVNEGAELVGEFGRIVYNKFNPTGGKNALKELRSNLPFKTWGIHYRDEIGNISTSNAIRGKFGSEKQVLLQLRPRFPIVGGWRSNWVISYNLPTFDYLQQVERDPSVHILTQPFGFSIQDVIAENYTLKVILPEGATETLHQIELDVDRLGFQLTHSYLDTVGRPTLIFNKKIVSSEITEQIKIQYRFQSEQIFREPLMIFTAFLIFFMFFVAVRRIELVTFKLKEN